MLAVSWINSQIVFDGVIQGLAIAVIAVGVVLVYRATRIINFAVGNMGVIGAVTLSLLVLQYGVPFWAALVIALLIGLVFGAAVEMTVIRRLKNAPRVVVLVSTIGIAGLAQAIAIKIPQPTDASAHFPTAFSRRLDGRRNQRTGRGSGRADPGSRRGRRAHLVPGPHNDRQNGQGLRRQSLPGSALGHFAEVGLHHGVGPSGGAVDTLGRADRRPDVHRRRAGHPRPPNAVRGARSGRHRGNAVVSRRGACGHCHRRDPERPVLQLSCDARHHGPPVVHRRVHRRDLRQARRATMLASSHSAPALTPSPNGCVPCGGLATSTRAASSLLGLIAIVLPIVVTEPSRQQLYTAVLAFAICASSLTVLTGWLGQLSLGQMAFAGLAALFAARLVDRWRPLLDSGPDDDLRLRTARLGHRHRVAAGARAVSRRRDVRLRPHCAAVLLFPALLLRRVPRRCQRSFRSRQIVVPHLRGSTHVLLRGPRRPGARPFRVEPLP